MIRCERNLKDETNGQRHGGKEEKEQERKDDLRAGCPGVAAVRGDLYKGKDTFPYCQSLALRERWHFACEMTERAGTGGVADFWWVRVSRRAALLKKPHRGFFARRDASAGPQLFESTREGVTWGFYKRKRPAYFLRWSFGGRGWIRTTEAESSRFTVCPHWPLGNTPIFKSWRGMPRTT